MKILQTVLYSVLLSMSLSGMDVTWEPTNDASGWAGWVENTYRAYFTDQHCPVAGDVVALSTNGNVNLGKRLKRLQLHWPQTANIGFALVGNATWIHDVRNLTANPLTYSFLSSPEFFGWWRFNRADKVTINPTDGDTTAVLQRMEASGRVNLNVDAGNRLVVSNLFGMGTVRKVGAGDFEVVRTGGEYVNLDVRDGGTLTVHEQEKGDEVTFQSVLSNAYVHFDASDIDNFEFNADGRISKWKGSAPKPTASATELTTNKYGSAVCIRGHDAPLPRYVANYSATGLGVVDFGPYRSLSDADLEESGAAALQFVSSRVNFSEAFIVFADNDPRCRQCVFSESHNNTFPRGTYNGALDYDSSNNRAPYTGAIVHWDNFSRNALDVRVNGRLVPSTFPVGGRNLKVVFIDCSKAGNAMADESMIGAFARHGDKTHIGGIVVAEFIGFYNRKLTDAERQSVNTHLMRKWLAPEECEASDLNNLAITDASEVSVPEGEVVKVNQLTTESRIVKTGEGRLDLRGVRGTSTGSVAIDVQEGGVAFRTRIETAATAPAADPLYHFDVSDASSLTTATENGTNFVTAIRDQHDDAVSAVPVTGSQFTLTATTNDPPIATAPARPFLRAGQANGKTTLCLGARRDHTQIPKDGYQSASALYIPQADTATAGNVFEGFVVIKGGYCIYPFGSTNGKVTICPDGWHILFERYSLPMRSGEWTVNGIQVNPFEYAFNAAGTSGQFVVLRFSATDMVPVNAIGIQDTYPHGIGGVEFGEWIVYNRRLSEQERRDTEAYLMKKWLGKSHPLDAQAPVSVSFASGVSARLETDVEMEGTIINTASSSLTKAGSGRLAAVLPESVSALTVEAGEYEILSVASNAMASALIHLDATVASSLEYDPSDATKIVRWNDVRGAGRHYAEKNAARYASSPTLLADAQNGLPVVDFGDTTTMGQASGDKTAYNNYPNPGKALCFDEKLLVREGFLVLKSSSVSPILGGWDETSFHYDATHIINANTSVNHSLSCLKREAEWRVDENEIDIWNYTWTAYQNEGTGYHVLSFAITNDYATVVSKVNCAPVQNLCADRAYQAGGKKYGEVVLFDRSLTVAERAAVRQHLVRKWNTADIGAETLRSLGSLALSPDATVSLGGIGAVGAFAASGVGTVASDFTLSEDAAIDATCRGAGDGTQIAVTGTLTLPSVASLTLTVDMPNDPETGSSLDLFTAEFISGSPAGWQRVQLRDASGNPYTRRGAHLSVVTLPNGKQALRATICANGLFIIFK